MNYELALKLKENGFPQTKEGTYQGFDNDGNTVTEGLITQIIRIPTLSELIEACGDGFGVLKHFKEERFAGFGKPGQKWFAESPRDVSTCKECKTELPVSNNNHIIESGSTPEEAVANLWLELNKK